jgi:hypothetical protein
MDRSFLEKNAKELERLRKIVHGLMEEELNLQLYKSWTISVALAHLAFWDQRSLVLMQKWKKSGITPSPIDIDTINDSLLPLFLAIPSKASANLAISCAESIDRELEETSEEFILKLEALKDNHRLNRYVHRKIHLDDIQAVLESNRSTK